MVRLDLAHAVRAFLLARPTDKIAALDRCQRSVPGHSFEIGVRLLLPSPMLVAMASVGLAG